MIHDFFPKLSSYMIVMQVATASQFFISYTIRTFGALAFATIMTTRQVKRLFIYTLVKTTVYVNCQAHWRRLIPDVACEHFIVMFVVCTSTYLGAVHWSCKSTSIFCLIPQLENSYWTVSFHTFFIRLLYLDLCMLKLWWGKSPPNLPTQKTWKTKRQAH